MSRFIILASVVAMLLTVAPMSASAGKKVINGCTIDRDTQCPGADLSGQELVMANLTSANLKGANLKGANLEWAKISGVDFTDANLEGANLNNANMLSTKFHNANLRGATINSSYLHKGMTMFKGADLSGATFKGKVCAEDSIGECK